MGGGAKTNGATARESTPDDDSEKMKQEPKRQSPPDFATIRRLYPRSYKPWSDEEDGQLRQELETGKTVAEIARLHRGQQNALKLRIKHIESL